MQGALWWRQDSDLARLDFGKMADSQMQALLNVAEFARIPARRNRKSGDFRYKPMRRNRKSGDFRYKSMFVALRYYHDAEPHRHA